MVWMEIPDWPYEASDTGCIRRTKAPVFAGGVTSVGRKLKPVRLKNGYDQVTLTRGFGSSNRRSFRVHRLVAMAFLGNPRGEKIVCHRNGVRHDNRVGNLYWGSHADNTMDALRHGTMVTGEDSPHAVLTGAAVHHIRRKSMTQAGYARLYGVSKTTVRYVQQGKTWRHIND